MKLPSLNTQILLGAFAGVGMGILMHPTETPNALTINGLYLAGLVGTLFIDLLKMILVPLVFFSITSGIANLRRHRHMQRVWINTLLYFMGTMALAILVAMLASLYFKPGSGLQMQMFAHAMQDFQASQMPFSEFVANFLHGLFVNPFQSLAQGNVLPVVMFSLFFGIALVLGGDQYPHLMALVEEALDVTMRIVNWVMRLAPYGIAALLAKLVATQDMAIVSTLAQFIAVVIGTLLFHGLIVLPMVLYIVTRRSPLWLWRGAREAFITAFATSSSSATLPVTMRCVNHNLKVKPEISGFVLPLGATMNMDGTALYEAAAALFVANLVGIDLTLLQQAIIFFTAMLASVGAPGIPSAGMVTMVLVLQSVGLPVEAIAILLPVDRLLDTLRTTINVEGDVVGSVVVEKWTESS